MKKIIPSLLLCFLIVSCSNNDNKNTTANDQPEIIPGNNSYPDFPLISKYDCGTCHKKDEKVQGPSFMDIASKYSGKADNMKYLSQKVIEGGSGVWGNVPMAAHPCMPKQDLDSIISYILSLKK